jgi:DNA-binding transcriptional MerR regulator
MERYLSPSEVAKRFGISIKALRHYESCGLLAPKRTSNGSTGSAWRVYGPDQVARLHQILALKRLGLTLARIGEILAGPDRLAAVLELQEQALIRQEQQLGHALALVRAAQAKLQSGQALSIDDLATLNQETVMQNSANWDEISRLMKPLGEKNFTEEQRAQLKQRRPIDQERHTREWDALFAEAKQVIAKGDPTSPQALDLARRWKRKVEEFTLGDSGLHNSLRGVWRDSFADPNISAKLPLSAEEFAFIGRIVAQLPAD